MCVCNNIILLAKQLTGGTVKEIDKTSWIQVGTSFASQGTLLVLGLSDLAQWLAPRTALSEKKEKGDEWFTVNQGWIQNP